MDDPRLPVLRPRGGRWRVAVPILVAGLGAGCIAPGPEPSLVADGSPPAASPAVRPVSSTAGPTATATDPATSPEPTSVADVMDRITVVCAGWTGEPPPGAISCKLAAQLALDALGSGAADVRRLEVGIGDGSDSRPVAAIRDDLTTTVVRVVRAAAGDPMTEPPVAGPTVTLPEVHPPAERAPDLGADAPAELRIRSPLPFCGTETIRTPDGFDTRARRCFLDLLTAWAPAELVTIDETGEAGRETTVLRFDGTGSVAAYVRLAGGWTANRCAITPIATIAVFVVSSPCAGIALGP